MAFIFFLHLPVVALMSWLASQSISPSQLSLLDTMKDMHLLNSLLCALLNMVLSQQSRKGLSKCMGHR